MDDGKIVVTGLADLQRALRQIDKDLPKELAAGLAEAAGIVVDTARPLVPRRSGKAAASLKVRKQQRAAAIAVGGATAPWYPWLDFGGRVGRGKSVARDVIPGGRYIYPALRRREDQVRAKVDEALERLARRAGFDTDGDSSRG